MFLSIFAIWAPRGPEDELYIRTILSSAAKQSDTDSKQRVSPKLCIMDARAFASAVANGYVGGGRENPGKELGMELSDVNYLLRQRVLILQRVIPLPF